MDHTLISISECSAALKINTSSSKCRVDSKDAYSNQHELQVDVSAT